jgi:hypothetical protein
VEAVSKGAVSQGTGVSRTPFDKQFDRLTTQLRTGFDTLRYSGCSRSNRLNIAADMY